MDSRSSTESESQLSAADRTSSLVSIRSLLTRGDIGEAIDQMIALRRVCPDPGPLIEDIRKLTLSAIVAVSEHAAKREFGHAAELSEKLLTLCPAIAELDNGFPDWATLRRHWRALEISDLVKAALQSKYRGDYAGELDLRLRIHRHPGRGEINTQLQLHNAVAILARLLAVDVLKVPAEAITVCREALAIVTAIPPLSLSGYEEPSEIAIWERLVRHMLSTIDLDMIFGAPFVPQPPFATDFFSSDGASMTIEEVAARCGRVQARAAFFCSASPEYFERYAKTYVTSIFANCNCDFVVIICICAPLHRVAEIVATRPANDPRLIYCCDNFDGSEWNFRIMQPNSGEPGSVPSSYYASAALLRMDWLLRHLALPVFVSGIDTVLQHGVADLLARFHHADIVLNKASAHFDLGGQLVNNLVLAFPTESALLFTEFLKKYLGDHLRQNEQPAGIDQLDLHMGVHHLRTNIPEAVIEFFDPADINCVMFNRLNYMHNEQLLLSYRFLNMFVGAVEQDIRLKPEHLDLVGA
jgi:hypothetical protein